LESQTARSLAALVMTPRGALSLLIAAVVAQTAVAQTSTADRVPVRATWAERMALSQIARTPDPRLLDFATEPRWEYTSGLVLLAIDRVGDRTGDGRYREYVRRYYDQMIGADGSIVGYDLASFNIDRVNPGRALMSLHKRTPEPRFAAALATLRRQLEWQPRTRENGFWHKLIYPRQMWLDGAYMGSPFYAEYARDHGDTAAFTDVARQLKLMNKHMRDARTGLLYHGWDESRVQRWANPETGTSPNFWGRAMGWYAMALVDVLEILPSSHADRPALVAILRDLVTALAKYQDARSGLWYQVVDQGTRAGNYLEASASTMIVYAIAKGVRLGVLDASARAIAERGYEGILKELITVDADGHVHIERVCAVAGLGGSPYRDGTYDYYVKEPVRRDDPKGVGPFIMASLELGR
jgi:unsaturated rhamnogalacturonyl hydrolase